MPLCPTAPFAVACRGRAEAVSRFEIGRMIELSMERVAGTTANWSNSRYTKGELPKCLDCWRSMRLPRGAVTVSFPQFFKLLLEQPPSEGLTSIHGGLAENQPTVACFRYDPRTDGLSAAKAAGIKHHIALSVVGDEHLAKSAYLRAKFVQERLIKNSRKFPTRSSIPRSSDMQY